MAIEALPRATGIPTLRAALAHVILLRKSAGAHPLFSMSPDAADAGQSPELVRRFRAHYLNEGGVLAFNDRDALCLRHVALAAAVFALIRATWSV